MRHMGEAGNRDQKRHGVGVPRHDADHALDDGGQNADRAERRDIAES